MSFPMPANETQRLAALRALDVLDTAPEVAYDEICELAAQICGCPAAYISFVDEDRQWLKARYGLSEEFSQCPRASAFCTTTICGTEMVVVPDLRQDPRFNRNPMVTDAPYCRFYCGMPLITDEGYALGSLCVMDFEPRRLAFEQLEALRRLSRQVLSQLELCRKLIEYDRKIKELDQALIDAAGEKARTEELLLNMLPAWIAAELKENSKVRPKYTRSATILFADFKDFMLLTERLEPVALVDLLDQYFSAFDEIAGRYRLEKVKTIGDGYMAVAGVTGTDRRHPVDTCLAALAMQATVARMTAQSKKMRLPALELRIGIHTGPVISGVVGSRKFTFDIWGDAVNTAALMEVSGEAGRINVSEEVTGYVDTLFELEPRGPIQDKHERSHRMFFLNRLKRELSRDLEGRVPNKKFAAECDGLLAISRRSAARSLVLTQPQSLASAQG